MVRANTEGVAAGVISGLASSSGLGRGPGAAGAASVVGLAGETSSFCGFRTGYFLVWMFFGCPEGTF